MSTPDPVTTPVPAAIPWYKSHILQGILVAVIAQGFLRLKTQFSIDLSAYGIDANGAASWIMDIVSATALSYAARARVVKPLPVITANKTQAAALNSAAAAAKPPEDTQ